MFFGCKLSKKITFTAKQNYFPWKLPIGERLLFEPLACGMYLNVLLDREFWGKQPNKYPDGYYWFSTRMRFHAFVGERMVGNRALKPKDYLSLSFGVKLQVF